MEFNRRKVIKSLSIVGGAAVTSKFFVSRASAEVELSPVGADNATAKMLGYNQDHSKVDTTKYPRKAGQDNMKCSSCLLFASLGEGDTVAGLDKKDWGKCSIFPNMVVAANGWCNSWSQKA